jgi:serine phosphatase RsbU (regulator of sigma subunit)
LFEEGDQGEHFYVVADGEIQVIKASGTPNERTLAVRSAGDFIGELSLINPAGRRMACVRSSTGARLWRLSRADFDEVIQANPLIAYQMVRELSRRLTTAHELTIRDLQEKNREISQAYDELKAAQDQLVEKERIERELELAHTIQQSILPDNIPSSESISFGAFLQPARAVGGDFYDIYHLGKNKIGVMIGDVADKGVPSALVMAQTHALIFAESFREPNPARVLHKVNNHVFRINRSGLFITVIYGVVDTVQRTFSYARAGHEIPMFKAAGEAPSLLPHDTGQPLGIFEDSTFDEQNIDLSKNFTLLLYTDGVLDIRGDEEEQYGIDRLERRFAEVSDESALTICSYIWEHLAEFKGNQPRYDDVTMIVLRSEG